MMAKGAKDAKDSAIKLLQGYIWHPQGEEIDLGDYLPRHLGDDIHLIWDVITPPFTFFDDGTLAASQRFYQFTAVKLDVKASDDPKGMLPWLEELIGSKLETTPKSVGWQIFGDLRNLTPINDN
jgi:methionine salvage enolase-phosphatase E1